MNRVILISLISLFCLESFGQIGMTLRRDRDTTGGGGSPPTDYIAHYDFNGDANDNVAPAANGTVTGATLIAGKDGGSNTAYELDGINDNIQIPDSAKFDFTTSNEFSISMWVKRYNTTTRFLLYKGSTGNNREYLIDNYTTGSRTRVYSNALCNGGSYTETLAATSTGSWQHIVLTVSSSTITTYINGSQSNQSTGLSLSLGDCGSDLFVGDYGGGGFAARMDIDDLKLWDRELTSTEVSDLYTSENAGL